MIATGVADLPLVGGHPTLDLVNTVEPRASATDRHDRLATPADLLIWARRVNLVDAPEAAGVATAWAASPPAATEALASVKDTREALYAALVAILDEAGGAAARELAYLSARWAGAASRSGLVLGRPSGVGARLVVGAEPELLVPDRVAHAAVALLCDVDLSNLRACPVAEGGCGWVFLDRSRNGSRRWCLMADCGAQVKARRLTERRRVARQTARRSRPS